MFPKTTEATAKKDTKIEAGSPGVSLEQLLNSWFALGGTAEMKLRQHSDTRRAGDSLVGHGGRQRAKNPKTVGVAKKTNRTK